MSSTLNTYQLCAEDYLGDIDTNISRTTSDDFRIGYTAATAQRGIDLGDIENLSQVVSIDFNSLDGGSNDFDTRIRSVGGEAGVNGRGILQMNANEYHLFGNTAEPEPEYKMPGYVEQPAIPLNVSVNQGRTYDLRYYTWNGQGGTEPTNPVITIQLRDPVSLTPWFGAIDVYMTSAYLGNSSVFDSANWLVVKNATPPTDIIEAEPARAGNNLSALYAEVDWNATGYPQLKLFNKIGGASTFRYIVRVMIFPDNDAF